MKWIRDICVIGIAAIAATAISLSHAGPAGPQGKQGIQGDSSTDLGVCLATSNQISNGIVWITDVQITTPEKSGNGWSCPQGTFVSVRPTTR